MRGVHSAVDDIRRNVFTEVARLAYEGGDLKRVDEIPYKMIQGEVAHHRHDVFLERAIVQERVRLALGMDLQRASEQMPVSASIAEAATDQRYFEEPLVNIIPFACNACPPKQIRITDSCQGCLSHPCMNVCPKDAIYLDKDKHCHIDQEKCIKCGRCFNQCPYHAISKIERPCAAACGMDAIESDELGRAKINYDKCVSCGMCLVNCPFAAIADKSQIFQVITAMNRGSKVIACVAPAFVGQFGKNATPAKLKAAMRILGFDDVVEVAIGADLCTVEEAKDFLEEVPEKLPFMGTSCCPAWSVMAKKLFPEFKDCISMALTPMVITARMVKKDHPDAKICFVGPCAAKKLEANRKSVRSDVDYVLTFEELQGMFDAKSIDFATLEADPSEGIERGHRHGPRLCRGGRRGRRGEGGHRAHGSQPGGAHRVRRRPAGVPEDADDGQGRQAQRLSAGGHGLPRRLRGRRRHHHPRAGERHECGEVQEGGRGGQQHRQPLCGPPEGRGGAVSREINTKKQTGPPTGRPCLCLLRDRRRLTADTAAPSGAWSRCTAGW